MTQVCYSRSPKSTSPPGTQLFSYLSFQCCCEKAAVSINAINREQKVFCAWSKGRRNV